MTNKELSDAEKAQVKKIETIVNMFREIINSEGALENKFYLDSLPPKVIDGMRGWLWIPFEEILTPEESQRFKRLRILLTDPIDVLLDVSKKVTSLEEYNTILRDKFKWTLRDTTQIHPLACDLLSLLSYDQNRVEKTISIIITTVSQWDDKAMTEHQELLRLFRPEDLTINHAEIIPMRLDSDTERMFACYYPWGGNYAERLQAFLTEHHIAWCEDPRTAGSDCYGMLIATKDGNLDQAIEHIQQSEESVHQLFDDNPDNLDEDQFYEALSEARWDLDFTKFQVIDISTDWKHLETDGHVEALSKVGVKMTQGSSNIGGVQLFTLALHQSTDQK